MPPSLLQLIHSLPLDLVAWYRNRYQSGERTVTLVVILGVPITALPIAIATAVVIPTGAMISSMTTVVSFTRLGRSNSYQRLVS
jgi:hypothetical protein